MAFSLDEMIKSFEAASKAVREFINELKESKGFGKKEDAKYPEMKLGEIRREVTEAKAERDAAGRGFTAAKAKGEGEGVKRAEATYKEKQQDYAAKQEMFKVAAGSQDTKRQMPSTPASEQAGAFSLVGSLASTDPAYDMTLLQKQVTAVAAGAKQFAAQNVPEGFEKVGGKMAEDRVINMYKKQMAAQEMGLKMQKEVTDIFALAGAPMPDDLRQNLAQVNLAAGKRIAESDAQNVRAMNLQAGGMIANTPEALIDLFKQLGNQIATTIKEAVNTAKNIEKANIGGQS